MTRLLLIALGGAAGAVLRYAVSGWTHQIAGEGFPWGTLAVNVIGSLAIGFFWGLSERTVFRPEVRPLLFIGVLGGFTTFSTYSLESFQLLRDAQYGWGVFNMLGSNLLCIGAVFVGYAGSRLVVEWLK